MKKKTFYSLVSAILVFMFAFSASAHIRSRPHPPHPPYEEATQSKDLPVSTPETVDYSKLPFVFTPSSDTSRGVEKTVCQGDHESSPPNYFEVALIMENATGSMELVGSPDLHLSMIVTDPSKFGDSRDYVLETFREEKSGGVNLVAVGGGSGGDLYCEPINIFSAAVEKVWYVPTTLDSATTEGVSGLSFTNRNMRWGEEGSDIYGTSYNYTGPLFQRERSRKANSVDLIPTLSSKLKKGVYRLDYKFEAVGYGSDKRRDTEIRYLYLYLLVNPNRKPADGDKFRKDIDVVISKYDTAPAVSENPSSVGSKLFSFSGDTSFPLAYSTADVFGPSCPIDINGDGAVDIVDLVMVGRRFGEMGTFPRWVSEDVNGDGKVDIIDLVLVAREFGNSCVAGAGGSRVSQYGDVGHPTDDRHPTPGFASILKSIFWVGVR